jgi:hypothetical protein
MYGNGRNPELFARALDAQRDLASVRDQDLVEHDFSHIEAGTLGGAT